MQSDYGRKKPFVATIVIQRSMSAKEFAAPPHTGQKTKPLPSADTLPQATPQGPGRFTFWVGRETPYPQSRAADHVRHVPPHLAL